MRESIRQHRERLAERALLWRARHTRRLRIRLPGGAHRDVVVKDAQLRRHVRGRRALVDYRVSRTRGGPTEDWIGKIRFGRPDLRTPDLHLRLREKGFGDPEAEGAGVPEPVGRVEALDMWLQRRVAAPPAGRLLQHGGLDEADLGRRLGRAIARLHASAVVAERTWTVEDELARLDRRFSIWAASQPEHVGIMERLRAACRAAADGFESRGHGLVHNDLHLGQLLVDPEGPIWIVDLDEVCMGDAGMDIGNLQAQLVAREVRDGRPEAHRALREALVGSWRECGPSGTTADAGLEVWTALAFARKVGRSFRSGHPRHVREAMLAHAHERLERVTSGGRPG